MGRMVSYILVSLLTISMFINVRSCTKVDETKYDQLHKDNENLQSVRDSLIIVNDRLKLKYDSIQSNINMRDKTINKLNDDLKLSEQKLSDAVYKAYKLSKEKSDAEKKIEELQKNPIRRNDDELLNSLKNKLKP